MTTQQEPSETGVTQEVLNFLYDRRARGLSRSTIEWYQRELTLAAKALKGYGVFFMEQIGPKILRKYFYELGEKRNPGGLHSMYRTLRAFFNWYSEEIGPGTWVNPIKKVKIKAPIRDPLPGVPIENVLKMAETCEKDFYGKRDRAILLTLVDTGARRTEFLKLDLGDLDLQTGSVHIRFGKGGKQRTTYVGAKAIRAIIRYLRVRGKDRSPDSPLWLSRYGRRLGIKGLEQIVRTRANLAGVPVPGVHDFRRTFALESLRNNIDVYSLMRLMGHTSPQILNQYLALVDEDLAKAHQNSSPLDHFKS